MHRLLTLFLVLATGSLWGQSISGSIQGTVVDPSDLPIVGATVTVTNIGTGATRTIETNVQGGFVFGTMVAGEYSITVEFSGFKSFTQFGINLTAADRLSVGTMAMEVGAVTESITVEATGSVVQTASAERSGIITSTQVDQIAIKSRTVMQLLQLLPGVVNISDPDVISRGWNISVNGNRRATTSVSLDGMASNAIGNNNNMMMMVSQDAIAEVKVLLSNYQAEYGRMSGANVHLITKSGTQDFHGGLSYYKRHEQFNANNFFNNRTGSPKPRYRFNTYSYNVGGPIHIPGKFNTNKDKLFFFWSQEFWPLKTAAGLDRITVPTQLEKAGNFSQTVDQGGDMITVTDPFDNGKPFPGNVIPASRVDSDGRALLNVFPDPNFLDRNVSGGSYNYVFQGENESPKRTSTLKINFNPNPKDMISVTFGEHSDVNKGPFVGNQLDFGLIHNERHNIGTSLIGSHKHIFSPTLINELNIGWISRPNNAKNFEDTISNVQRDTVGFTAGQFNSSANPFNLIPEMTFNDVPSAADVGFDGRFPLRTTQIIFNVNDNISKVYSNHTFKAGFYFDYFWRGASTGGIIPTGRFNFGRNVNNPLDTNYGYSNAALGVFNSYTESTETPFVEWRLSNIEWFVQDTWKATRRLTIDAGMRFMMIVPIYAQDNMISGFVPGFYDAANAVQLIRPTRVGGKRRGIHPVTGEIFPASNIGRIAPGTGDPTNGMVQPDNVSGFPRALVESRGVQFAPRVGFAYDVFGNSKTAVRGGVGIFYNRQNLGAQILPMGFQTPLVDNPVINFGQLSNFLGAAASLPGVQNVTGIDTIGKIPTVYNWNFTIQQDIGFGTVVDVAYVGNMGRHLMWQRELNNVPAGANFDPANIDPTNKKPLARQFLVPFTGYNNVNYREWGSSSNYHGLQVSANRRFARGITFGLAYTWSKSLDYNSGETNTVRPDLVAARIWNYGLSDFDRTHVLKVNCLWDIPRVPTNNPVLNQVVNGWQLSGIYTAQTGRPRNVTFRTTKAVDFTGTPSQGPRLDHIASAILPRGERTFERYFNTEAFALPEVGTFGNMARSVIRDPGINSWDLAIFKNFKFKERASIQFRAETYNTFNHTQFNLIDRAGRWNPATGAQVDKRFGQLIGANDARIIQLALRLLF